MSKRKKKAGGHPAKRAAHKPISRRKADDLLLDFRQWLTEDRGRAYGEPDDVVEILQMLLGSAHDPNGASLLMPPDYEVVSSMVEDVLDQDDDVRIPVVETLHDYLHFLQENPQYAGDSGTLSDCVTFVEQAIEVLHHPADVLAGLFAPEDDEAARTVDRQLAEVQLVRAVDELLEWLGAGRPATSSRGLRRADIAEVAAMLGIAATGVTSKYDDDAGERAQQVQTLFEMTTPADQHTGVKVLSMWEIEELTAWWRAMEELELLEFGSTRVYPGPAVEDWASEDEPTGRTIRQNLVVLFISELLAQEAEPYQNVGVARWLSSQTIPMVGQMLMQMVHPDPDPSAEEVQRTSLGMVRVRLLMEALQRQGVVQHSENEYWVPEGLRAAVAQAVLDITVRFFGDDAAPYVQESF